MYSGLTSDLSLKFMAALEIARRAANTNRMGSPGLSRWWIEAWKAALDELALGDPIQ